MFSAKNAEGIWKTMYSLSTRITYRSKWIFVVENDPRRVVVTGRGVQPKGLRVNEPAVFNCFTKDAGEGELTNSVLGPGRHVFKNLSQMNRFQL